MSKARDMAPGPDQTELGDLLREIESCRLCAERFAKTATAHGPRPVLWLAPQAPIWVAGQAPGARVHEAGKPFWDRSGDRLRDWMGLDQAQFYDRRLVSVLPTAFCFPGYTAKGADLPPPAICWQTWHRQLLAQLPPPRLRILVGGYAFKRHLEDRRPVTEIVQDWRAHGPDLFALPHPSWRNSAWLRRNPWFEQDVLPRLRARVGEILAEAGRA